MATFGFWFRRYAPFKRFGNIGPGDFEGDNRGPSTSLQVTSRTYCCVMFDESGINHDFANSSGTEFRSHIGGVTAKGASNVRHKVERIPIHGPGLLSFKAHSEGGNPLVPKSPDIDTFVEVNISFLPGSMRLVGEVRGDNFPALEVFLFCYTTKNTAMLLDGRTTGGANSGPGTRLFGSHEKHVLGRFNATLALRQDGALASNYIVKSITMPNY